MSDILYPEVAELLGPSGPQIEVVSESPRNVSAVALRGGAFDGASRSDQLALWAAPIQSANQDILPDKEILDARTKDIIKNDAHIQGGAAVHKDNIAGALYLLNSQPDSKRLFGKEDPVWEEEFQEEVETKFTYYAESPECWLDAQRTKTLTEIVRLAIDQDYSVGEALVAAEWMPDDGRPFRTAMQIVDTDRLMTPYIATNREKIFGGVEVDRYGAPIAYHIRNGHPGDWSDPRNYQFRRVMANKPWGRPQILHQYDQVRPAQARGISTMVSALREMKMLKQFRQVELQRAVLAATFAASLESELPAAEVMRMLGDGVDSATVMDYMAAYLGAVGEFTGNAKNLKVDGARIPVLPPGTKMNIKTPEAESPAGDKFEESALRYLASATGTSYEALSKDYSRISYATGRMSKGQAENHMAARKKRVADQVATFGFRLWLEEGVNKREFETLRGRRAPAFYVGQNVEAYAACSWIGAGSPPIDPLKERQADILGLKNGLTTKEAVIAKESGKDWRRVSKQIAREMKNDKALDIPSVYTLDATDKENALSGTPQVRENNGENNGGDNE